MEAQRQEYRVDIYQQDITMTVYEDGSESRFVVSPDQFSLLFAPKSVFIPEEGLVWEQRENGVRQVLYVYPQRKEPVTIYQVTPGKGEKSVMRRYKMLFPAIAILANISAHTGVESVSKMKCWCLNSNKLTPETKLYEPPIPNCRDGSICLGNIERKIEGSVKDSLWKILFDTVFSSHLSYVGVNNIPFQKFAKEHQGKRVPLKKLEAIGKGRDILRPLTISQ